MYNLLAGWLTGSAMKTCIEKNSLSLSLGIKWHVWSAPKTNSMFCEPIARDDFERFFSLFMYFIYSSIFIMYFSFSVDQIQFIFAHITCLWIETFYIFSSYWNWTSRPICALEKEIVISNNNTVKYLFYMRERETLHDEIHTMKRR